MNSKHRIGVLRGNAWKIAISVGVFLAFFAIYLVSKRPKIDGQNNSGDIIASTEQSRLRLNGNSASKPSENVLGFPEKWDSMDFFYNDRLDTNIFKGTNIYAIGDNLIVTNVIEYRTNKYWNTQTWEDFSRFKVDQQINYLYPELSKVIEILQELPAVQRSNRLYSGVYSITFTMDNIRRCIERYLDMEENESDVGRSFESQGMLMSTQVAESHRDWLQSQRIDMQKEIHEMLEIQRQALIGLYGEMPLPIFQRIMAIESGLTYKL